MQQRKRIKFLTLAIALKWLVTYPNVAEVNTQIDVQSELSPDQSKRMN